MSLLLFIQTLIWKGHFNLSPGWYQISIQMLLNCGTDVLTLHFNSVLGSKDKQTKWKLLMWSTENKMTISHVRKWWREWESRRARFCSNRIMSPFTVWLSGTGKRIRLSDSSLHSSLSRSHWRARWDLLPPLFVPDELLHKQNVMYPPWLLRSTAGNFSLNIWIL